MAKAILKDIGRYFFAIILLTILYIIFGWVSIFDNLMPVYFYRSTILLCVIALATFVILLLLAKHHIITTTIKDIFLSVCLGFLLNFIFLGLVTVSFDRSISIYLISYMAAHPDDRFTKDDIETVFLKGYVEENKAMQRRIDEQVLTGSFTDNHDGTYSISDMGQSMVEQWKVMAKLFRVNPSFLYPSELNIHPKVDEQKSITE